MEAKLVRDKLDHCYQTEGVNHLESCEDLRERYIEMLRENSESMFASVAYAPSEGSLHSCSGEGLQEH